MGPNQFLQSGARIRRNLTAIASVVTREKPHVLAVQEADGPSVWSGRFDHVAYLASEASYPWHFRGNHAPPLSGLDYGTALLSTEPMTHARSRPFHQNWRDAKGFVEATLDTASGSVDIVSVHLDFLRREIRRRQMLALYDRFEQARRPVVLLGDFNCQWSSGIAELAARLDLHAWHPHERRPTYPSHRPLMRIDWALASPALSFRDYRVVPDHLSDHLGILVELDWR